MKTTLMITFLAFVTTAFANNSTNENTTDWDLSEITYPQNAIENDYEGTVLVYFTISNGKIVSTDLLKSVSPSLDKEALNFIHSQSPKVFKQLEESGKSEFILPVLFEIR